MRALRVPLEFLALLGPRDLPDRPVPPERMALPGLPALSVLRELRGLPARPV